MAINGKDELKSPLLQPSDGPLNVDRITKSIMFKVSGIECASCATSIESALEKLSGVESVMVSPLQGQAVVRYIPEHITAKKIKETIEDAGFEVSDFPEKDIAVCRLRIKGMACTNCSESAERALSMVDGVKKAVVGLALEEAKVNYDPNITDTDHIIKAIEDAGFGADLISSGSDVTKVHFDLDGISSPEDLSVIQCILESQEGVQHVEMNLEEHKVTVSYDPDIVGPRSLIHCIQEAGQGQKSYHARLYNPPRQRETEKKHEIQMYRNHFWWSCIFTGPVLIFSMVLPMLPPYGNWLDYKVHNMLTLGMLLRWIFSSPVQFIIGRRFYIGSYHALRRRSANMDVLVALGTNAAYLYSVYVLIKASTSATFKGSDFFETSSMLISFILLGKYLEVVAKGRTSDALAKLTDLAPDTARLLTYGADGNIISEEEISTQLIQRDDILKIVPGAKVPADGIIVDGQSHVNESMITGEARPVAKRPGDKVIGGTMNENGCLLVKATHVGSETALSQIVQIVEAAQLARAPVQKLADRISKFFVPAVVIAAFATWLGWFIPGEAGVYPKSWIPEAMDAFELALQFGISVLVVACPCALGLATPTAVMVATGKGASQGVLIKGGDALEKAHKVKTVVFDKTGTLTAGKPTVVSAKLFSKFSMEEFCNVVIAIEANSEHPIAKAVVEHAKKFRQKYGSQTEQTSEVKDFEVHPGAGVGGKVGDKTILVGNRRLMWASNVPVLPEVDAYISENEELARTCILVSIDGRVAGAFAVTDPVKPEAARVISFLQSMGISCIMVTGDNYATATAIAKEVGIQLRHFLSKLNMSSSLSTFNLPSLNPKLKFHFPTTQTHFPNYNIKASSSPNPNLSTDPPSKKSFAEATGDFFLGFASRIIKNRIEGKGDYGNDDVKMFGYDDDIERENMFWKSEKEGIAAVLEDPLQPEVIWEQRLKDVEAERRRKTVSSPGFSFSAAGLLFPYHLGVAQLLIEKGYIKEDTPLAGSSAGAIVCAVIASGSSMQQALVATKVLAEDCRLKGTAFRLGAVLRELLLDFLPDDVHIRSNGRVRVAVTQILWKPIGLLVDQFDSKEDLINAVVTSSFIPGYLAPRPATIFRNRLCIDGGLTLFMPPTSASKTVRVCAFPTSRLGLQGIGISPDCNPENRATPRQLFNWALEPAEDSILDKLFELGYLDAAVWAEQNPVEMLVEENTPQHK